MTAEQLRENTYSVIAEVGSNVTSFKDEDVESGETYAYRVAAFSGSEISASPMKYRKTRRRVRASFHRQRMPSPGAP